MTLIDLITAQSARLTQAGVSFGHGTGNAFDEAAWLVLADLGLPLDALEQRAGVVLSTQQQKSAEALVTRRIESRRIVRGNHVDVSHSAQRPQLGSYDEGTWSTT